MKDNIPNCNDPFEVIAKAAANRKLPEPRSKTRRPTNALRPKAEPAVQMPDLFEAFKES